MDNYIITLVRYITWCNGNYPFEEITNVNYIVQYMSIGNSEEKAIENVLEVANVEYPDSKYLDEDVREWEYLSAIKIPYVNDTTRCLFYTTLG